MMSKHDSALLCKTCEPWSHVPNNADDRTKPSLGQNALISHQLCFSFPSPFSFGADTCALRPKYLCAEIMYKQEK